MRMTLAVVGVLACFACVSFGVEPKQVDIPARIVTIDRTMVEELGIDYSLSIVASSNFSDSKPPANVINMRGFDFNANDPTLNQLTLNVQRRVNPIDGLKGLGFKFTALYGSDAGFTHSNGLLDYYDFQHAFGNEKNYPQNQLDLLNAFADIPIIRGSNTYVRVGKFRSPMSPEPLTPLRYDSFYTTPSLSYLSTLGLPKTQTGVMLMIPRISWLNDGTLGLGITRGWDQSVDDNNGSPDFLGTFNTKFSPEWDYRIAMSLGPQQDEDTSHYRFAVDTSVLYKPDYAKGWQFGLEAMFAGESENFSGECINWYGLNLGARTPSLVQLPWANSSYLTGRAGWFHDRLGSRTGFDSNYYSLGLEYTAKWNVGNRITLDFTPNLRFDYADEKAFDFGTDRTQFTAGVQLSVMLHPTLVRDAAYWEDDW